ncbi:porin [Hyphobacterium sp.]|uniref:porin n=1 Tax=Hyphobacterium sp. TaxID=2004662 RepID=UPI003BA9356A
MTQIKSAILFGALSAALAAAPAHTFQTSDQQFPPLEAITLQFETDAALVVSAAEFGGALLADLQTRFEWEGISGNGWRWGVELGLHAQKDSAREGFANRVGRGLVADRSLATGRYTGGNPESHDRAFAASAANLFLKTGWGDWRLGLTPGAAAFETRIMPTASAYMRLDGGPLTPNYGAAIRTLNAGSGLGPTLVYSTPRIIGLRASASFTAETSYCGIDLCRTQEGGAGVPSGELNSVFEAGISFDRTLREWGQIQLGVNALRADPAATRFTRDYTAIGLQARWSGDQLSAGVSTLWADNAVSNGAYTAIMMAIRYDEGPWSFGAEWARSDDDLVLERQTAAQLTASRFLGDQFSVTFGLQNIATEFFDLGMLVTDNSARNGTGAFLELAFRN